MFSFFNSKHFQVINIKFMIILIHNFPINNETKKKDLSTYLGQLIKIPFVLPFIAKSIFLYSPRNLIVNAVLK